MLERYQTETCPYCQNVREKLSNLGVSYVIHNPRLGGKSGGDVTDQQTYDELIELGGEDQVPSWSIPHAARRSTKVTISENM